MKKTIVTIGLAMLTTVVGAQAPLKTQPKLKQPTRPHDLDYQAKNFAIMGMLTGLTIGAVTHPNEPLNPEIVPPDYDGDYTPEMMKEGERANNMTTLYTIKSVLIGGVTGAITGWGIGMIKAHIQEKRYKRKMAEYRKQKELIRQLKLNQVTKK